MKKQFTTFKVGDQLFALEVIFVREINQQMEITPVQHAPEHVRGLINLRGQIITIFDLGARLGLEERTISQQSHNIILKTDDELAAARAREERDDLRSTPDPVGLLVDAIGDVIEADENEIDVPPANVGEISGEYLSGVVKLEGNLLVVLDPAEILKSD